MLPGSIDRNHLKRTAARVKMGSGPVLPHALAQVAVSRPLRIEFAGANYHAMARGNNAREPILADDEDGRTFLEGVVEACGRFEWVLLACCLLDNRYHLLVKARWPSLARAMRKVNRGRFSGEVRGV